MFTGIIEATGQIKEITRKPHGLQIQIHSPSSWEGTQIGDSIALNGVCLTAIELIREAGSRITFDVGPETLACTTLSHFKAGDWVNLERPLQFNKRIDGHLVQGHVDGIGKLVHKYPQGEAMQFVFELPPALIKQCIVKGSIAINGTSLTINEIIDNSLKICMIPHTLAVTTFSTLEVGHLVNIETDMLSKYVSRQLSHLEELFRERT